MYQNKSHSWMKLLSVLLVLLSFQVLNVNAAERHEFYNGVRSLGMGGVSAAVVNDETALLANPAGLGKLRDYFVTVADPEIELNGRTQVMVGTNLTQFMDPQAVLDLLNQNLAERFHQKLQLFPSFVVQNFGIGLYGNYVTDAYVDAGQTNYELYYRNDMAFVMGFNFRIWDGRIKLGMNLKAVNRILIDRTDISPASTGLSLNGLASEGLGVGSDVGLIMSAPWKWLPTLAFVYHDVGGTSYNLTNGMFLNTSTRPPTELATLDAAIALYPIMGKSTRTTFSVELKDALSETDTEDINRRLHYGIEFNFSDALFLRGGMNQNYWTAGAEIAMFNYQIQLATYGEEVGTAATPQEDRRYIFKFAYRF